MSSRMGMADGRCFTVQTSSRIFNEELAYSQGMDVRDNLKYRQFLQTESDACTGFVYKSAGDCLPLFPIN